MPSTYSSNLKIQLMATGEDSGTWGNVTNTNLGTALEQAIVGYGNPDYTSDANLTISLTDSNAAQAARALVLNVTSSLSLTATRELVVPTIQKQYIVQNNTTGSQSITVKTSAGTGITVPSGRKAHLYVDGTDVIQMFDFVDINGGAIDGTTVGASSASTGAFTTLTASGATTLNGAVALGDAAADLITVPGTVNSNVIFTDNSFDIGASGATRPRTGYFATSVVTPLATVTTVNATTVDATNLEVTNIKAKDGTAAATIADSTGVVTVSTQLNVDNLNLSVNTISSTDTNGNIVLAPNGTGDVQLDADTVRVGDSGAAATITTNGAGNLTLSTNAGTNSGTIVINQGANGDIALTPNGTGEVDITKVNIDGGTIDGTAIGGASASTGAFTTLSASSTATFSGLTASQAVFTTAGKALTSNAITGTGNVVMSASPTLTGTISAAAATLSGNLTLSGGTANGVLYLNGSKVATSGSAVTYNGTTFSTSADASVNGLTVGRGAGAVSTNTAVGASALAANTSGSTSTAIGENALGGAAFTGSLSVAVGNAVLYPATSASNNVGVGYNSLRFTTTGSSNTAVGTQSLFNNTTASNNTAVGYQAGYYNTTGIDNTLMGYKAGSGLTTGSYNTFVGREAGFGAVASITSSYNTAVGYQAGYTNSTGAHSVYLGYQAGYTSNAAYQTMVGDTAGQNATGAFNTFIGAGAGYLVTSGAKNTILGGYTGNNGGLDIRTASNYIVLSDGDGNPRAYWNGANPTFPGNINFSGAGFLFDTTDGISVPKTVTATGTTGAQTINKTAGTVNFAAAATSLVVTNSFVDANSIIIATVGTNDTTMKSVQAVAAAGSFTLYANAAATAETRVNFMVIN